MDPIAFLEYWRGRIEKDLLPFADPGTRLEIAGDKRTLTTHWNSRGQTYEATFSLSLERGVQVEFRGQTLSYRSFLASPGLADLLGLAKMILQSQQKSLFVPTQARRITDETAEEPRPAVELLSELLNSGPTDLTNIVMVTGEAGAGKTKVLQELVKRQADKYQRGQADCLYLYINAQGRALARFNEALATELQDLRAVLTYHAVSVLVRVGALVPVIDGFDELLGVGGYEDAFSSLTGFIEELEGHGQVVASARSTYYEQEFVARSSTVSSLGSQAWTQVPVEVLPWEHQQFSEYIDLYASSKNLAVEEVVDLKKRADAVFSGQNEDLKRKPLFVAKTLDVVLGDPTFAGGENLLQQLVMAYLERERREKLLDRQGGTLLSTLQLELLFKTLAEEMWNQETRELDRKSVREVAEYVLVTQQVPEGVQRVVIERMSQLAFLIPGEQRAGGIAFEHEMFFSYFLAQVFEEKLFEDPGALRVLLSRSVLPVEVAQSAIASIDKRTSFSQPAMLQQFVDRLAKSSQVESPRSSQVKENAGVVIATALKQAARAGTIKKLRLWGVIVPGGDLNGVELRESKLVGIQLRRVDLTKTRFVRCNSSETLLSEVVVNPHYTRLELEGLDVASDVLGLQVREAGLARGIYDPIERRQVLIQCGALEESSDTPSTIRVVPDRYEHLLQRLARAYRRMNPVCTSDDTLKGLFQDGAWPALEDLLVRHGVVTVEKRATRGQPKVFLRRQFLPDELMAGADRAAVVDPRIRAFWDSLESVHH